MLVEQALWFFIKARKVKRMDYYEKRRCVILDIDEMLRNKRPVNKIKYLITERYGFSGRIVDERIKQLKALTE